MTTVFIIGLFLAFFLDGSISQMFSGVFYSYPNSMVPYLTMLWLILTLYFVDFKKLHIELWAAIIGFLFDMYYTGILGIYLFAFPLVVYICRKIYNALPQNFLSGFLVYFLGITILVGLGYFANDFIGLTNTSVSVFLVNILAPTLAINLIFFLIFYFPIDSLYMSRRR